MNLYKTINRLKQYQVIRQIQRDEAGKQESARAIPKACGIEAATRRAPADTLDDLKKRNHSQEFLKNFQNVKIGNLRFFRHHVKNGVWKTKTLLSNN